MLGSSFPLISQVSQRLVASYRGIIFNYALIFIGFMRGFHASFRDISSIGKAQALHA